MNDKEDLFLEEIGGAMDLQKDLDDIEFNKLLRSLADSENSKKRLKKDCDKQVIGANKNLIRDLLVVLDSFEAAVQGGQKILEMEAFNYGIALIHKQLMAILKNYGIKAIDSVDKTFDPTQHEALRIISSSKVPEKIIIEEYRKGYTLYGAVIRPSQVGVSGTYKSKA